MPDSTILIVVSKLPSEMKPNKTPLTAVLRTYFLKDHLKEGSEVIKRRQALSNTVDCRAL